MRAATGTALLAAILLPLVPGRAADPTADELIKAVERKLADVAEVSGQSIACVVVSRSDKYPKPAAPEHPGELGGFDPKEFVATDPTPARVALSKQLDLSDPQTIPSHGSAGGVVIDAGGLVLTTYAAIDGATKIYVHLPGRRGSYADIHAADSRSDLAVLRLLTPPAGLRAVPVGEVRYAGAGGRNNATVFPGKLVVLIAYPYSAKFEMQKPTAWLGSIGGARRIKPRLNETAQSSSWYGYGTVLEFNTLIQPRTGVSAGLVTNGGAVLNLDGELLGLTTTTAAAVGDVAGPVYVLPLEPNVGKIVAVLRRGEEVEYGFLGVRVDQRGGGDGFGIRLGGVTPGGPAEIAGVRDRDTILDINGVKVNAYEDLLLHAGTALAGSKLTLGVRSAGERETRTVTVVLGKFKNESPYLASKRPAAVFGLRVDYSSVLALTLGGGGVPPGVVVRELVPDSPAAIKFKALGDGTGRWVIVRVNGVPIGTPAEFYKAAEGKDTVRLALIDLTAPGQPEREVTLP